MKTTNLLKIAILLFGLSFLLWNCEKEESNELRPNISLFETVSEKESISFLNENIFQNKGTNYSLKYDISKIKFENITNSPSKLAVIPAKISGSNFHSRVLLLKINNTIKSVVYNMYSNPSQETTYFSGEVTLTDLSGNPIKAFKYQNGVITNTYVIKNNTYNSRRSNDEGEACRSICKHKASDKHCICNMQNLNEVEIRSSSNDNAYVPVTVLYGDDGGNGEVNTCEVNCNGWDNGGVGNADDTKSIVIESPETPVEDIEEYLKCFDTTKSAQLTIHVNQPIANNGSAFTTGADKAGHAFISITQGNITRVYGLYPQGNASPYNPSGAFSFGNNQNDGFDISISFNINSASLNNIINDANNYLSNYNLNSNNCTDYVIQTAALCGVNLPDPQSTWLNGGGSNPGAFGQAIRNMNLPSGMSRNTGGGNANSNNGNCN